MAHSCVDRDGRFLSSGSPVLFSQTRVGLGERPFSVKKFRTMRALKGAEAGFSSPEAAPA